MPLVTLISADIKIMHVDIARYLIKKLSYNHSMKPASLYLVL